MNYRRLIIGLLFCLTVCCTACSEFNRILKSTDNDMKYEVAMDYYDRKDYNKALQLFDLLQNSFRSTPKGEMITYRTAMCYYLTHDYEIAAYYFNKFVTAYPFSKDAEDAAFMNAYCSYMTSPISTLDQKNTLSAISQFESYIEKYPQSDSIARAKELLADLNNKLEEKDYNICLLYYKMENYNAAITCFENLLKNYPNTSHREEILSDMAKTYYEYAENSVPEKQKERYESCIERYNTLSYLFPDSPYLKEVEPVVNKARKKLENIY
ncbi:MAG: outer membrane protein assembly factor BamD [Bacteroidales bacterium]|nr:outer membrane protein assembly factor BamD [Bacteroidales bacterium]MBR4147551.1 outer membrane protein assembly factor BamD [Bacteroidales bacterium]